MKTRPAEEKDLPILKALYDGLDLEYDWADPLTALEAHVVVDENDKVLACAVAQNVPEITLIMSEAHPAARLHWLRMLHKVMFDRLTAQGYDRAIAMVPPKIERSYGRRLMKTFGWEQGFTTFVRRK